MRSNSIIRTLFNPLRPYWILYLIVIIIGCILLSLIPNLIQTVNFQQIILTSLISILISVTIFYFGIKERARLQYADGLNKVISEMQKNHSKIIEFPQKIEENYVNWEKTNEWKWIDKQSSYTNWGDGKNFHLKYLPTSAYFNFVNQGYILNQEYLEVPTEHIAHFYQFCIRFNNELQSVENQIRKIGDIKNKSSITKHDSDCSGNVTEGHTSVSPTVKTDEKINLKIEYLDAEKPFKSKRELCNFLKCELFQHYAHKNNLNEGLTGEFQIVMDSLNNFCDSNVKTEKKPVVEKSPETPLEQPKMALPSEEKKQLDILTNFFTKASTPFAILSIIGALISLLPSFLDVIVGKEWNNILLSTEPGFYTLTILLIITYTGAIFMLFLLVLITRIFYNEVLENKKCFPENKILYSIFMLFGGIAVGSLILFLSLSWIARTDFSIKYNILIISLIFGYCVLIGLLSILFTSFIEKNPSKKLRLQGCFVIIIGIVLFFITPVLIGTFTDVSNYYKDKEFGISLESKTITYSNNTPSIIALSYQLPIVPGNLTFFDVNYAQCHWSTNYGYFFTKNPKYSLIKKYEQDIIIPNCPYFNDQIYWTYEISEFSVHKPPVFIGITLEDTNNPTKKLGSANISFNWSDTDAIKEVKNSTLWIS